MDAATEDSSSAGSGSQEKEIIICYRLKIWTRVIGWLELVGGTVLAVLGIAATVVANEDDKKAERQPDYWPIGELSTLGWINLVMPWIFVGLACLIVALFLEGNEKERPGFFIPYLILSGIRVVFLIMSTVLLNFSGNYGRGLGSVCKLLLSGFLLFVVHKRYSEIKEIRRSSNKEQERAGDYEGVDEEEP